MRIFVGLLTLIILTYLYFTFFFKDPEPESLVLEKPIIVENAVTTQD